MMPILAWAVVEMILHAATFFGILPLIPTITPSVYTRETVKFQLDKHGSPIFIDGNKVYQQLGIPTQRIRLDSAGYRPIDAKRFDAPTRKIGFFGDSYTEGLQVADSETFPRLIEGQLKQAGKSTICFNFGVGGTGTYQQYLRYLTVSKRVELNDVVLCFLPQNDVLNNDERLGQPFELPNAPYLVIRNGEFVAHHPDADTTAINRRVSLLRSTVGLSFVATGIYRMAQRLKTDGRGRKANVWKMRNSWLGVYGEPSNREWVEAWTITEESLLRFAKAVKERGGRFTLVLVADSLQIARDEMLGEKRAATCDFEYPNRRLAKFCAENDIVCLDSLSFFLERKRTLDYPYFSWEHDGHYAPLGHRTLADFLVSTGRLQ